MRTSFCIDWHGVSDRVQLSHLDHDVKVSALRLLDRVADIIDNREDNITDGIKERTCNWLNSEDISKMLYQGHLPFSSESAKRNFINAVEYLSRVIPQYPFSIETAMKEVERRKTNPYPGCYGYSFVYAGK